MKKLIRPIIRVIIILISLIIFYLAVVIIVGSVTDYQPDDITELQIIGNSTSELSTDATFTFISWNIGYCGLGAEMDFFYDGGEMVRPTPELIKKYTNGVLSYLKSVENTDFILLQEVDKNSARTRKQDETELINNELSNHAFSYGINYNVRFVPLPFTNPLGKVEMGQVNFSKYKAESSQRFSFFSAFAWPKRLFMLDRCFVVTRFKLQNDKELVLINTHNSAYDSGGKLREQEMPIIRDLMIEEFEKGNYVVAGGDWNQNPPDYNKIQVDKTFKAVDGVKLDSTLFPKDWQIVYDPGKPTNRGVNMPLALGKTEVTIIDYFIVSPNVKVEEIKVLSQSFEFSDHEPVYLKISL